MPDTQYLRGQAALCLEMASEMTDPKAAEKLRADAARYHKRAVELEAKEEEEAPRARKF